MSNVLKAFNRYVDVIGETANVDVSAFSYTDFQAGYNAGYEAAMNEIRECREKCDEDNGWTRWDGGGEHFEYEAEPPVSPHTWVEVQFEGVNFDCPRKGPACHYDWWHSDEEGGREGNIVAYRVIEGE